MKHLFIKTLSLLSIFILISTKSDICYSFNQFFYNNSDLELDISGNTCQPPNLRKTTVKPEADKTINFTGLENLNISGSGQFSKTALKTVIDFIGNKYTIYDIDLRQEPHGFINDDPICWSKIDSDTSPENIISEENNKLQIIPLNSSVTYANVPCKKVIAKSKQSESDLASDNFLKYKRFPVKDGELPSEDIINDFIDFAKSRPENSWFHFHCKEGIGRTTTFMIMYDILINKDSVPLEDIINRQIYLIDMKTDEKNGFLTQKRLDFFKDFYNKDFSDNAASNSIITNCI